VGSYASTVAQDHAPLPLQSGARIELLTTLDQYDPDSPLYVLRQLPRRNLLAEAVATSVPGRPGGSVGPPPESRTASSYDFASPAADR